MHATTNNPAALAAANVPASALAAKALKVLAFMLGQEEYGIDIQKVQELRGYDTVTRLPMRPSTSRAWSTSAASSCPSSTCASSSTWARSVTTSSRP